MDPIIQQMMQCKPPIRNDVFARWVEHLVKVVQPQLDRLEGVDAAVMGARTTTWKKNGEVKA